MLQDIINKQLEDGYKGLPKDYPTPPINENSLFYIQRNQNKNTVIYEINRCLDGSPNATFPIYVYWIKYNEGGEQKELNFIQNKLAYGYESKLIDRYTFEFNFVSYPALKLFVGKDKSDSYRAFCNIDGKMSVLTNIYVYAEELGVFPDPKYIELYGQEMKGYANRYEKIHL